MREIRELLVHMAEDDPSWGYARIQGALRYLGHRVARTTIARVLKECGIGRSSDRPIMIFVGTESLERAIAEYVAHYHEERSHQGLGNRIPSGVPVQRGGLIRASERLGGLLRYYHRRAA